jgi:hypothetical protein
MDNGGDFPWECYSGWSVKLITKFHPVPTLRMVELYLHSPICGHGRDVSRAVAGSNTSTVALRDLEDDEKGTQCLGE